MTKSERACTDMADVCELAHKRTVRECKRLNVNVNCLQRTGVMDCRDEGQDHSEKAEGTHYGITAQDIFNRHYDYITNVTGL